MLATAFGACARRSARALLAVVAAAVFLPACGSNAPAKVEHVVDLVNPTAMATRQRDPAIYVAEQAGRVVALRGRERVTVLDVRNRIESGGERGLLGIAFSPDGKRLYIDHTVEDGDIVLAEYEFGDAALEQTRRVLLRIDHPAPNHNGGQLAFGPDGMLYMGVGDGGQRGRTSQTLRSLLGKILRIDPSPSGNAPYTIPADNPFVGTPDARPEIFAYGLRNPWRFSFDRRSGDLWIGDVGEGRFEEINLISANRTSDAVNFGWNVYEGNTRRTDTRVNGETPTPPLFELGHEDGDCSIIGGFVYRGTRIPELAGAYFYSDFCNGVLRWIRQEQGEVVERGDLDVDIEHVTSFGEDSRGELYVLSQAEGLLQIVPA